MSESSDHIAYLLQKILDKMTEISYSLDSITNNVSQSTGIHNLDDVIRHIDRARDEIVGPTRCTLTDLHGALRDMDSNFSKNNRTA